MRLALLALWVLAAGETIEGVGIEVRLGRAARVTSQEPGAGGCPGHARGVTREPGGQLAVPSQLLSGGLVLPFVRTNVVASHILWYVRWCLLSGPRSGTVLLKRPRGSSVGLVLIHVAQAVSSVVLWSDPLSPATCAGRWMAACGLISFLLPGAR